MHNLTCLDLAWDCCNLACSLPCGWPCLHNLTCLSLWWQNLGLGTRGWDRACSLLNHCLDLACLLVRSLCWQNFDMACLLNLPGLCLQNLSCLELACLLLPCGPRLHNLSCLDLLGCLYCERNLGFHGRLNLLCRGLDNLGGLGLQVCHSLRWLRDKRLGFAGLPKAVRLGRRLRLRVLRGKSDCPDNP